MAYGSESTPPTRPTAQWVWIAIAAVVVVAIGAALWLPRAGGTVEVPDLTGLSQSDATRVLQEAGLKLGNVSEVATDAAAGTVVEQLPLVGSEAENGSAVDLVISSGPELAAVPELAGLTRAEAESALEQAGLQAVFTAEYDETVTKDAVIDQLPAAGETVAPGSSVGVLLSLGARPTSPVTVPDVSGRTRAQARVTLRDAGLDGYFVEASDPKVAAGSVVEQTPVGGVKVAPGTEVLVLVSTGPAPPATVAVPAVVGKQADAARSALEDRQLASRVIRTYSQKPLGEVVAQEPVARTKVATGTTVGLLVSAGPAPSKPPANPPTYPKPPTDSPQPPDEDAPQLPDQEIPPADDPQKPPKDDPKPPPIETVRVPSVVGLAEQDAVAALLEAGLEPVIVPYASDDVPEGTVVTQLPGSGEYVYRGYSVLVTVSTGPADDAPTDETGETDPEP